MRIFTSYYKRISDRLPDMIPIRISTSQPSWFKYTCGELPELYPGWPLINAYKSGEIDDRDYVEIYVERLDTMDAKEVYDHICRISNNFGGKDVVLLCYEAPDKFCHRHLVAGWLSNQLDIEVKELE